MFTALALAVIVDKTFCGPINFTVRFIHRQLFPHPPVPSQCCSAAGQSSRPSKQHSVRGRGIFSNYGRGEWKLNTLLLVFFFSREMEILRVYFAFCSSSFVRGCVSTGASFRWPRKTTPRVHLKLTTSFILWRLLCFRSSCYVWMHSIKCGKADLPFFPLSDHWWCI